ncbi:MAG: alpha/beta fold hydrolase [Myxococcaceae bacterium]|jgi:carboxylesterase|nr:alpha/beta fold hydrolase [Myxococcaceae bacterium]MCA3013322.1 alpha/beta fold hydrolase [Myxococcaceae bacterium]
MRRLPVTFPLDPARTAAFDLGPADAGTAVLLLHGFTGSPWEVRPLAESLADRGFFVRAPRLPGHGTTPEAMCWVTRHDWLRAADEALDGLSAFPRVCVAGLSMGALLALLLAERRGPRVSKLVLMAPVMRVKQRAGRLLEALAPRLPSGLASGWVQKASVDLEDDEARAQAPLLPRYPLARLLELFELQRLARGAARKVRCPALIAAAVHDHVVDFESVEALHREVEGSRLLVLQRGFHLLPRDLDRARLATEVADFVEPPEAPGATPPVTPARAPAR